MANLVAGAILVGIVAVLYLTYRYVENILSKKSWLAKILTIIGLGAGIAGTIYIVAFTWRPATKHIMDWLTTLVDINPLVPALSLTIIIDAGILLAYMGVRKWLGKVFGENSIGVKLTKPIAIFASIYVFLDLTSMVKDSGGLRWWMSRIVIGTAFIYLGNRFIKYWFEGEGTKGQDRWGVFTTYVICTLTTVYISQSIGWSIFSNTFASTYTLSFYLGFNLCIFWLSYGLGDPKRKLHKRIGFYITTAWLLCLIATTGVFVVLQASGKLAWAEQETARISTEANRGTEDLERSLATVGLTDKAKQLDEILGKEKPTKDDLLQAKRLTEEIAEYPKAQRKIPRGKLEKAEAVEKTINYVVSKVTTPPYHKNIEFKESDLGVTKVTKIFERRMMLKIEVRESPVKVAWPGTNVTATLPIGEHPYKVEPGGYITFVGTGQRSQVTIVPWEES